eukprot:5272311-Pyramimonas_sp.AAC.1
MTDRIQLFSGRGYKLGPGGEVRGASSEAAAAPNHQQLGQPGAAEPSTPGGSSSPTVIMVDSPEAGTPTVQSSLSEAVETLSNMNLIAASWTARLPDHAHAQNLAAAIEAFQVTVALNMSKIDSMKAVATNLRAIEELAEDM